MTEPQPKKSKESTTISMVIEKWKEDQSEQFSSVQRVNGYPWRLRLFSSTLADRRLALICDKSSEAELWHCSVLINCTIEEPARVRSPLGAIFSSITFKSWDKKNQKRIADDKFPNGARIDVEIITDIDGDAWRRRSFLDPLETRDGILVLGEEMKKMQVHKSSLASQSSFFDRLFNGDFKEKNMEEIPIRDVEYENFANIIRMVYGFDGALLTDDNAHRVLLLADRFDFKIVEDRVVSFFLSSSTQLTLHQRLIISEEYNLPFLAERLISMYTGADLEDLKDSQEFNELSTDTIRAVFKRSCEIIAIHSKNRHFGRI